MNGHAFDQFVAVRPKRRRVFGKSRARPAAAGDHRKIGILFSLVFTGRLGGHEKRRNQDENDGFDKFHKLLVQNSGGPANFVAAIFITQLHFFDNKKSTARKDSR
ncbi:MAG: hypothetical protein JSS81_05410 [Acidobacteria bacterium]|nr:hypothetical protein [Acidobacteriota bacterium]